MLISVLVSVAVLLLLYLNGLMIRKNAMYKLDKRLDHKTVLVTGGTAGIGLEIARDLAKRGARLIVACPFIEEGTRGRNSIIKSTGNKNVTFELLDLASFKSVREFAAKILNNEDRLDILINNAGILYSNSITEDGIHRTLQVNYFGHFLLTILLLPLLMKSGSVKDKSRIINVSSLLHAPFMDLKDLLKNHKILGNMIMYQRSKLCLLLFAHELSKRLHGSNVVINSVNPGAAGTTLMDWFSKSVLNVLYKTPVEAAQVSVYAALDEEAGKSSGQYFRDNKAVKAKSIAYNCNLARKLWDMSVKIVKLDGNQFISNVNNEHYFPADSREFA